MSRPVQVLVAVAAVVVIVIGGLFLLGVAQQAQQDNTPEAKCHKIVADLQDQGKGQDLTADQWDQIYSDCVARGGK